jgi:hypothetical protein
LFIEAVHEAAVAIASPSARVHTMDDVPDHLQRFAVSHFGKYKLDSDSCTITAKSFEFFKERSFATFAKIVCSFRPDLHAGKQIKYSTKSNITIK